MNFSKKDKKACKNLNYLLILFSAVTGYISSSDFASLAGLSVGITNSAVG